MTIATVPRVRREFTITKDQLEALENLLRDEEFFELGDEYGELVFDGSESTITISDANQTKMIKLKFLMNWVYSRKDKLTEPARALRVMLLIRKWFSDTDAVDLSRYNEMVIKASGEKSKDKK